MKQFQPKTKKSYNVQKLMMVNTHLVRSQNFYQRQLETSSWRPGVLHQQNWPQIDYLDLTGQPGLQEHEPDPTSFPAAQPPSSLSLHVNVHISHIFTKHKNMRSETANANHFAQNLD